MNKIEHALGVVREYKNFWLRFTDYAGLLKRNVQYQINLRNGLRFSVRGATSDLQIIDEIFVSRVYDRALVRLGPGATVIDVGAQSGVFAVAAAARGAMVFAFEPHPGNVTQIARNAALNAVASRVLTNELAVAGTPGQAELCVREGDTGGSTFYPGIHPEWKNDSRTTKLTARCVTLADVFDKYGLRYCDCLKLDCEGAEYDILLRADRDDLKRVKSIVMEYHPNGDVGVLKKLFAQLGFSINSSPDSCTLYAESS